MTRAEAIEIINDIIYEGWVISDSDINACKMAIKALSVEPCEDAISRQAVLDLIEHYNSDGLGSVFYGYQEGTKFADEVNKLPSVMQEQKMGHWIYQKGYVPYKWKCNQCSAEFKTDFHYCPNCGAKMESEK